MKYRALIVPSSLVEQARLFGDLLGESSSGMWVRGISPDGSPPPTYYISAGIISDDFAYLLSDPAALYQYALSKGISISLEEVTLLLSSSIISPDDAYQVMANLGLTLAE